MTRALALALVVGCGGGGKPVAAPPPPLDPAPESCPVPAGEAAPARVVPAALVESRRTAGIAAISPDDVTKVKIHEQGLAALRAEVLLCLDDAGAPSTIRVTAGSCVPAYDATITKAMADWRYRPFEIAGAPSPVCTTIVFVYRQDPVRAAHGATTDF